ncbi:MAG: hypothetical protein ABJC04_11730 [Verrucomicrobiota bacterium]
MKILPSIESWRVLTTFGTAELLVDAKGRLRLRGGRRGDETAAREWISLFMHEAILPPGNG